MRQTLRLFGDTCRIALCAGTTKQILACQLVLETILLHCLFLRYYSINSTRHNVKHNETQAVVTLTLLKPVDVTNGHLSPPPGL